jgi:hypothetical protein
LCHPQIRNWFVEIDAVETLGKAAGGRFTGDKQCGFGKKHKKF